ncbi:MAG: ATP-dependent DNA helicase RecG [Deltaproteobacteria bacterium]|nr:ATP-dependent DNA helicase RecG [Deltaproteobacteria bacterium]
MDLPRRRSLPPAAEDHRSAPHTAAGALQTPLRFIKGIGPKRAEQLAAFGLKTVEDLFYHLPFRYEDRRRVKTIGEAVVGQEDTFIGTLAAIQKKYNPRRRWQILIGQLTDQSAGIGLIWYRAPAYLVNSLVAGQRLLVHGKIEAGMGGQRQMIHPEFELLGDDDSRSLQRILPVYEHPAAVPLSAMRKWLAEAIATHGGNLASHLPAATMQRHRLLDPAEALIQLHQPSTELNVSTLNSFSSPAHRSIIFDELFYLQLGLGIRKQKNIHSRGVTVPGQVNMLTRKMTSLLSFRLTGAQTRVLEEIARNMESSQVMHRLIQGDVGAGKTMVAWFSSLRVIDNGFQVVWMAPTELLAEQHFRNLQPYAEKLAIKTRLVTGALPAKERKTVLADVAKGTIPFIVGTHALIQEGVHVPRMALGVIDEQHRFGVAQRLSLQQITRQTTGAASITGQPHMLLMSATPIPRSLAMVLYGDMDVSMLDEMPPGRLPVKTRVFTESQRKTVYNLVLDQLRRGHQAFVVYPLVQASEQLQHIRDATQMADKMRQSVFKEFGVGLVHGRMSSAERDEAMRAFRDGIVGVLVSTTVIEVGIDIPNATVMVIEHAERFGLSQLHQLRGRVGRGSAAAYCLLVNRAPGNPVAQQRLRVMERETDGFKIAEADLALRGPGEFLGTRQSGLGDFRLANLARDSRLLVDARAEAQAWLQNDPELTSSESQAMRRILLQRWGQRLQLGAVG